MGRPWNIKVGDRFFVIWVGDDEDLLYRFLIVAHVRLFRDSFWIGIKDLVGDPELSKPLLFNRYGDAIDIDGCHWIISHRSYAKQGIATLSETGA